MDRDTFDQFKTTLQGQLTGLCAPRTRTDGGYAGDAPPITTDQARAGFEELLTALGNKANAWDLDRAAAESLVDDADGIYQKIYGNWVKFPLAGDAPAAVVAWQKAARGK